MQPTKPLKTTLGDMIVALTEAALESVKDRRDAHLLVAMIVNDFLCARDNAGPRAARRSGRRPAGVPLQPAAALS